VVTVAGDLVVAFHPDRTIRLGRNLAGEPRDTLVLDGVTVGEDEVAPAPPEVTATSFLLRGALGRAARMAGATARVRDLTVRYAGERQQFGRPVARFQAVGQHLVRIASEAVLADMAVRTAASSPTSAFAAAAAKIVAGQAATTVAAAAHQAHGAIGMPLEYELGRLTRRPWSWRDEYGSESFWSTWLGNRLAGTDLWPALPGGA
jgi:acyl-CoA dehydrogenase